MAVQATAWQPGMRITAERLAARNDQNGTVSLTWTTATANQWVQADVVFPQPFATTPVVHVTPQASAPAVGGTTTLMYAVSGVTTTGFSIRALRSTAFSGQPFAWTAIA
ncbi:H-type lectin domain-containing protein [Streptomyces cyslabdanicus]|uniref:H-type lectin domain-containing protein n=1 Tax=Streptomyces cyslabdanicus TaxID=1470456 RepID=UPI004044E445